MIQAVEQAERTEEQILGRVPVTITMGGEQYEIRPLSIAKSRAWRGKLSEAIASATSVLDTKAESVDELMASIGTAVMGMPEKVGELVFAYAPLLPREHIEETATDAELWATLRAILVLAFPFVEHLAMLTALGKKTTP